MGGCEMQQFGDCFLVVWIFCWVFFQYQVELFLEGLVFFSVVFCQFIQYLQCVFGQCGVQVVGYVVVLQDFMGDVQWQIVGIDQVVYEVQVVWYKLFGVVYDEYMLYIQFQVVFMIVVLYILWCL